MKKRYTKPLSVALTLLKRYYLNYAMPLIMQKVFIVPKFLLSEHEENIASKLQDNDEKESDEDSEDL